MASTQPSNSGLTRVPACGSSISKAAIPHNDPLHIIALFVVWGVSSAAAVFPTIATRYPRLKVPSKLLFIFKHFGTGVLVATAFCHLLPTAFTNLLDPCLQSAGPDGYPDGKGVFGLGGSYPAISGAIAMCGVFVVATVEMTFAEVVGGRERHHHHRSDLVDGVRRSSTFGRELDVEPRPAISQSESALSAPYPSAKPGRKTSFNRASSMTVLQSGTHPSTASSKPSSQVPSRAETLVNVSTAGFEKSTSFADIKEKDEDTLESGRAATHSVTTERRTSLSEPIAISRTATVMGDNADALSFYEEEDDPEKNTRAILQCFLLEMGILFHSVFIGLALSVSAGRDFVVLFIAIIFHQTFEGLSLGTRIALLKFPPPPPAEAGRRRAWFHAIPNYLKPYLMAMTYGFTTPVGQAIGLILLFTPSTGYDPAGKTELIMVGSANAISSGLLLWAALVELLSADFFGEERNVGYMASRKWRWIAWVTVLLGAASMATVGIWA